MAESIRDAGAPPHVSIYKSANRRSALDKPTLNVKLLRSRAPRHRDASSVQNGYHQIEVRGASRPREVQGGMIPIEDVYEQIRHMAADAHAERVVLFGSRARGDNRPKSDIDIAIAGCESFDQLEDRLQHELWSLLELDIINLDSCTSQELRTEIARDGKVLYEKVR